MHGCAGSWLPPVPWGGAVLQSLRPKLSDEQQKQLEECFELMDADGSGAIDADELGAAFKVGEIVTEQCRV